jgi:hypothetical protein
VDYLVVSCAKVGNTWEVTACDAPTRHDAERIREAASGRLPSVVEELAARSVGTIFDTRVAILSRPEGGTVYREG